MKVLLVDIDSKIPNLALMKISKYHKNIGDVVGFNVSNPDRVYISCIFKKNREQAYGVSAMYPDSDIRFGGPGINYSVLPSEIENCKPDYDLYPSKYSQGYTTRGCVRNCSWCIVKDKEGKYRRDKPVDYFHDSRFDTVMVMDNNWLADQEWFMSNTDYILEEGLRVIEHGMDIRLLTPEIAERLRELKWSKPMKFAYDQPGEREAVMEGIQTLKDAGVNVRQNVMFYVLAGYNTTPEEDLKRCNELKKWGTNAFVMPYQKTSFIKDLARWSNRKQLYWSMDFEEYHKGGVKC